MLKHIAIISIFSLCISSQAFAQKSIFADDNKNLTKTNEEIIDTETQKQMPISPQEIVAMEASMSKDLEYNIENTSPEDVRELVRYVNYQNAQIAISEGKEYKEMKVNEYDKKEVRDFFNSFKPKL